MVFLYVLFALSVVFPIYTYALYPLLLKLCKEIKFRSCSIEPDISIIVIGSNPENKIQNIQRCDYSNFEIIAGDYNSASKAKGEIIIFTDTNTKLDVKAIRCIVEPFADNRIACVVGQQTNPNGNSFFWKYENHIKKLESRIGCVSGANESLVAVRKTDLPLIPESVLNKPFYITTSITEKKRAVVFCDAAKAYEESTRGANFKKHVRDAKGYWQALLLFPRMLFPKHGSFVYVSHRVMKWFVWLNMLLLLLSSCILALWGSRIMIVIVCLQIIGYLVILVLGQKKKLGLVSKTIGILRYFVLLNLAFFIGFFSKGEINE